MGNYVRIASTKQPTNCILNRTRTSEFQEKFVEGAFDCVPRNGFHIWHRAELQERQRRTPPEGTTMAYRNTMNMLCNWLDIKPLEVPGLRKCIVSYDWACVVACVHVVCAQEAIVSAAYEAVVDAFKPTEMIASVSAST